MTDLGHLLSSVEENVERAHAGAPAPPDALDRTRRTVRRRRTLRHTRDGALSVVALVAVGGVVAWGLQPRPAPTEVATTSGPTAATTAAPAPVGETRPLGTPVKVATPRAVPVADLLAATGPGWTLATVRRERVGTTMSTRPEEVLFTVELVSPTGERTALLETPPLAEVHVTDWQPGSPWALVSAPTGADGRGTPGLLDLPTGTFTPLPFAWEYHPLGIATTGESVWLVADMPADLAALDEEARSHRSPVSPGWAVAVDPEVAAMTSGIDPAHVPHSVGRLEVISPDGVVRDLGEVALPHRLPPLSPDRAWLVLQAPGGGLLGVDLRTGESHDVAGAPTDPACRLAGWADQHAVLTACGEGDGRWRLDAVDVAADAGGPQRLATSDVPVRDAWPLADGRIGLGRVVVPAPCDVTSDPAVLEDGTIRSLTDGWSPYDHGTSLTFAGGGVWTHLNGCYPGSGRADPQRDVRVDLTTGATTTLGWSEDRDDVDQVVVDEAWRVTSVDVVRAR
ncbi:hypothetical protein [Cellulomonas dongxiuzhuiae]|uniref:WD40 repeat domain-containing protein n=1 Tax=Cellulomonas dongxiuzhuiae TaxID=2819979 RepID=A0ABX8GLH3_9CELL|nr:hypothetical protein [Cellulomonas dongxiuzhuiae]MBO3095087.1 hypothetical protein [Cellulomonas dongxiuzhuiae]QWC16099.1 hypothetical protein KKR89_17985 [Cellulomonas dongxiuzhuiae]